MTYSVTIAKQVTVDYENCPNLPAQLTMSVTGTVGFADPGVFVYRIDPDTSALTYSHVAGPCDIYSYVYNAATGLFIRKNGMTLAYPSAATVDAGIAEIEAALRDLCLQMDRIQVLSSPTTVVITS